MGVDTVHSNLEAYFQPPPSLIRYQIILHAWD